MFYFDGKTVRSNDFPYDPSNTGLENFVNYVEYSNLRSNSAKILPLFDVNEFWFWRGYNGEPLGTAPSKDGWAEFFWRNGKLYRHQIQTQLMAFDFPEILATCPSYECFTMELGVSEPYRLRNYLYGLGFSAHEIERNFVEALEHYRRKYPNCPLYQLKRGQF